VNTDNNDTIAAVSTCLGEAGIGIVRLSGPDSVNIASKIFQPKNKQNVTDFQTYSVHLGRITDGENSVDEVLLTIMRAPKSYTREDIAEISCHGGVLIVKRILELCIKNGARPASPGEFTKRAYLNGRIDLSQAEAVCDLIKAKTDASLSCALSQLNGALSRLVNRQKNALTDIMAALEAGIDYAEDEIPSFAVGDLAKKIIEIKKDIEKIVSTFQAGKIFKEGVKTAIIGRPNVGKSSLLNLLVGEDRAIVTEIPGTTRDVIEETVNVSGIPLILMDTAGIRKHAADFIEKMGIDRTYNAIKNADLVLFLLDASEGLAEEDCRIAGLIDSKKIIFVLNKCDLGTKIAGSPFGRPDAPAVKISALKNEGIEKLKEIIYDTFITEGVNISEFLLTSVRHKTLLENAMESLEKAHQSAEKKMSDEFIAMDMRTALNFLGEITGDVTTEEILDRIFSNFCVGK